MAAYGILFPPVWTERLLFLNSTGQYDVITVYRNATDCMYGNLTAFIGDTSPALEAAIAADPKYRCVEYAVTLHDEAQRHGINCSVVGTGEARTAQAHAVVAFRTTDGGVACVDPTAMNVSADDYPGLDFSRVILLRDEWSGMAHSINASGMSPALKERRDAGDVTFLRLHAFLASDHTEDRLYDYPNYTCLDFAADLHNRAEAAGIKCGLVTVGFAGQTKGHAFNAFPTTDRGIVLVDCTGVNATHRARGVVPTDNIVYLANGSRLGELPIAQADGNLDYAFYLDRKDRIDAYRQQWSQYVADVIDYNAEVDRHDAQLEANDLFYQAYSSECDQYNLALAEYNRQMSLHNQAVLGGDPSPPPAPTNLAQLDAWRARLEAMYDQYRSAWNRLDLWRRELNAKKAALDGRLNALHNAEESKWVTFSPVGIVEDVEMYWG